MLETAEKRAGRRRSAATPLYFIDTSDPDVFCRDDEGREYENIDAAKAAAVTVLPDIARDELPDGDARTFLAIVRDADGKAILQAGLSLHVTRWCRTRSADRQQACTVGSRAILSGSGRSRDR